MALEFEISFESTLRQLADTQARLRDVGRLLDKTESSAGTLGSTTAKAIGQADRYFDNLTDSLQKSGRLTDQLRDSIEKTRAETVKNFEAMARSNTKATTSLEALNGRFGQLENLVRDTASKQAYVKWATKTAALNADLAGQTEHYRTKLDSLNTAEGRAAVETQRLVSERTKNIKAMGREAALADSHVQAYQKATEAKRQAIRVSSNYTAIIDQMVRGEREMVVTGQNLAYGYDRLTQRTAKFTAQQQQAKEAIDMANRAMVEGEKNVQRYGQAMDQANQLVRTRTQVEQQAASAQRRSLDELRQAIEQRYAAQERDRESLQRLTRQEAEYRAKLQRVNSLVELRNKALQEQVRASQVASSAQARHSQRLRENIELYQRQAKYAAMTNAQLLGLASAHGRLGRGMDVNAQAAASFRAALGGMNASIGIYTSSTVLAAATTYAFAAALRDTVSSGMEFTEMMSRAEAIMMTGAGALTESGRSMEALEMQVRALGQSTIFTATEVSSGLVDLGMAGLSAADSMQALKPALDLASIGGIDMGKSADIATNVMTAFKLQADDLTGVVDILATAVTNSNTNIEQMANALSYVGPAAQAAGFDLKDTTAAIEALSNAGIKSSKAGTGLRRFMLNIQNPTAKGAKVINDYGIGLQDAEGNTRSLIDILGQFNQALHDDGITPSERMAAVVDLVGVRAASAVSRMVSSVDELRVFRRQLDRAAGSAEEMRQKIEDNLTSDWKQVKSAFQELQLEVFDEFEWHLRSSSAALTDFFQGLTVDGPDGISELDRMIALMAKFGDVSTNAMIAFASFKAGSLASTFLAAGAQQARGFQQRLAVLNARYDTLNSTTGVATKMQRAFGGVIVSNWRSMQAYYASIVYANTGMGRLTAMAHAGTAALSALGTAASYVARALGWVGMLYGIYHGIKYAFSDTDDYVDSHNARIESLRDKYGQLSKEIEKTQQAKNRAALQAQADADANELSAVDSQLIDLIDAREVVKDADSLRRLNDRIFILQQRADDIRKSFTETQQVLGQMDYAAEDVDKLTDSTDAWASTLAETQRRIEEVQDAGRRGAMGPGFSSQVNADEEIRSLEAMKRVAQGYYAFISRQLDEVESKSVSFTDSLRDMLQAQNDLAAEDRRFEQMSATEKLVEKQRQLADAEQVIYDMDAGPESDKALNRYQEQAEKVSELQEEVNKLAYEYQDLADEGGDTYRELLELQEDEKKSLEDLRKILAGLNAERMALIATSVVNGELIDVERMEDIMRRQMEAIEGIREIENDRAKESKDAAREQERALDQAKSAYESLRAEIDPVAEAQRKFNDTQKQLDSLLKGSVISQDDYADALEHMRAKLHETRLENDEFYQSLISLREGYLDSPFSETVKDMARLNELLEKNKISMREYEKIETRIREKQNDNYSRDLPQPDVGGMDNTQSMPFGEFISATQSRVEGLGAYQERSGELDQDYGFEKDRIAQEANERAEALQQQRLDQQQHAAEMLRIKQDEHRQLIAAQQQYRQQSETIQQGQEEFSKRSSLAATAALVGGMSEVFGMVAQAGEEATTAQKIAFAAQKALSVAQIIMYAHVASGNIMAQMGQAGAGLASMTLAQGYASAALVGGLAIGKLAGSGGGESSSAGSGGSDYAGAFDKGGNIPSGKWGIAGEVGPEIVQGPAQVTSRKDTARMLGGGGGDIIFRPQINVTVEGESQSTRENPEEYGRIIGKQVEGQVMGILHRETRPNGLLDKWKRR